MDPFASSANFYKGQAVTFLFIELLPYEVARLLQG